MRRVTFGSLLLSTGLLVVPPEPAGAQLHVQVALTWEYGDGGWHPYQPVPRPYLVVHDEPSRRVRVPPGHMPRPGYCRLWFPGTPPGHQPAAQPCERLLRMRHHPDAVIIGSPAFEHGYDTGERMSCNRGRGRAHGRKC